MGKGAVHIFQCYQLYKLLTCFTSASVYLVNVQLVLEELSWKQVFFVSPICISLKWYRVFLVQWHQNHNEVNSKPEEEKYEMYFGSWLEQWFGTYYVQRTALYRIWRHITPMRTTHNCYNSFLFLSFQLQLCSCH